MPCYVQHLLYAMYYALPYVVVVRTMHYMMYVEWSTSATRVLTGYRGRIAGGHGPMGGGSSGRMARMACANYGAASNTWNP